MPVPIAFPRTPWERRVDAFRKVLRLETHELIVFGVLGVAQRGGEGRPKPVLGDLDFFVRHLGRVLLRLLRRGFLTVQGDLCGFCFGGATARRGDGREGGRRQRLGRLFLLLFQQAYGVAHGAVHQGVRALMLVGQGRVPCLGRAGEAIEGSVLGGYDLRGEHLLGRIARAEGGEGGGRGGEAFGILGVGFVGLGASCGGEVAEKVAGERVGWVDLGHGNGSRLKKIVSEKRSGRGPVGRDVRDVGCLVWQSRGVEGNISWRIGGWTVWRLGRRVRLRSYGAQQTSLGSPTVGRSERIRTVRRSAHLCTSHVSRGE